MTRLNVLALAVGVLLLVAAGFGDRDEPLTTSGSLVAAYDGLADGILALKNTEAELVRTLLCATFDRARAEFSGIREKLEAGESARADIENLAALVAELGNEGDASVAGIRKRLLEGGHHHNAAGEKEGIYDEGFVIVTRSARKQLLVASKQIGKIGLKPDLSALTAEWEAVEKTFHGLMEGTTR